MSTTAKRPDGPDRVRGVGLVVVFAAAAILSFDTLNRLAVAVGFHQTFNLGVRLHLSWLLPVGIDGYAWLTIREWLLGRGGSERVKFAAKSGRIALGLTMAANAAYHLAEAVHWNLARNPAAAVLVGAIPAWLAERVVVMYTLGRSEQSATELAVAVTVIPPDMAPDTAPTAAHDSQVPAKPDSAPVTALAAKVATPPAKKAAKVPATAGPVGAASNEVRIGQLRSRQPDITQAEVAKRLDISERTAARYWAVTAPAGVPAKTNGHATPELLPAGSQS